MLATNAELVAVEVHAFGVPARLARVVLGTTIVRTNPPLVVISSTYSGLVFREVPE